MAEEHDFEALTVESLPARLGGNAAITDRIGAEWKSWAVREIGDGNLNQVFVVTGTIGAVIVKQALPYVRLVGSSWPLPLKRAFFEFQALTRQEQRDPGRVPSTHFFDEPQALIVMEFLSRHVILRRAFIEGRELPAVGKDLGLFLARTLFRGSDLSMEAARRKSDLALLAGNAELCDITENLVFSDPFFDAKLNRHTSPELDETVVKIRADRELKLAAQQLKHLFAANAETLLHGDLHTGSVMVTSQDTRVIDPEFAFYGPFAFDIGILAANFWMSYFSQKGHESGGSRDAMRSYLLGAVADIWACFCDEFAVLWRTERKGILYQSSLFENQGDEAGAQMALKALLADIWTQTLGFAGIEIHRRILGLAHNADFETIEDQDVRAACEKRALDFARKLSVERHSVGSMAEVNAFAIRCENGTAL